MRVGVLPEKTDECSKVFLSTIESTEAQNRDRDNLNFGQTNTQVNGTTNVYTIGRGPLFQITDSKVSRFDIANESNKIPLYTKFKINEPHGIII